MVSAAGDLREVAGSVEAVVADDAEHCSSLPLLPLVMAETVSTCDMREGSGTALADRLRSRSDCEDCMKVR